MFSGRMSAKQPCSCLPFSKTAIIPSRVFFVLKYWLERKKLNLSRSDSFFQKSKLSCRSNEMYGSPVSSILACFFSTYSILQFLNSCSFSIERYHSGTKGGARYRAPLAIVWNQMIEFFIRRSIHRSRSPGRTQRRPFALKDGKPGDLSNLYTLDLLQEKIRCKSSVV